MSTSKGKPLSGTASPDIGTVTYHFPVLDSTNAFAERLLLQIRPKSGTVISTDFQTAGRGQFGRDWHSAPGLNLCISCILYPVIESQEQFRINMAVAMATYDCVAAICGSDRVRIKWPNDIYVEDRKVAGILFQNSIQGNRLISCIIGIGLNVNETHFPSGLPNPTSLRLEVASSLIRRTQLYVGTDRKSSILEIPSGIVDSLDIKVVQERLIANLSSRLLLLQKHDIVFREDYRARLYRRDILSQFKILQNDSVRSGTIENVDELGRLMIRWENGEIMSYHNREIEFVLNDSQ